MVLRLRNIERAREAGLSDDDIVDTISQNDETLSAGINRGIEAGLSKVDILQTIMKNQERGVTSDTGTQAITAPITGLIAAPRAAGEALEFAGEVITTPGPTIENTLRDLFGLEPAQIEEPADTFGGRLGQSITGKRVKEQSPAEFVLGKERAQNFKESIGIQALEDFSSNIAGKVDNFFTSINSGGPFGAPWKIEDLPTRQDARDALSDFLEVDLDPQTPIGRGVEAVIGTMVETAPSFGLKAASELGKAKAIGQTLRELGAPEGVATSAEVGSLFVNFKRPPAKEVLKKGAELSESEIVAFAEKNIKEFAEGALEGGDINFAKSVEASEILETIEAESKQPLLNTLTPAVDVEEGLGRVKEITQEQFTRERAIASNLYDEVAFKLGDQAGIFPNTERTIRNFLTKVEESGLSGVGREAVIKTVGELEEALFEGIPLKDAIKRKQNFNQLFDFDFPDLGARAKANRAVSKIRKSFTEELNTNLQAVDRGVATTFRKAEAKHRQNAERFGKDAVIKLQRGESVLDSRGSLSKPQDISFLKAATEGERSAHTLIDRLVLDELNIRNLASKKSPDIALFRKRMTPRGQEVLDELVGLADESGVAKRTADMQRRVLDDVVNAHIVGSTPEVTLKMMQNPKGVDLVRTALNKTKDGKAALKNVEDLFVAKTFDGLIKEGKVDLKKARELSRNKNLIRSLEKVNPGAAKILKDLPKFIESAERSLQSLSETAKNTIFKQPDKFTSGLLVLKLMGVPFSGTLLAITKGLELSKAILPKIMENPQVPRLLRVIEKNPRSVPSALAQLTRIVDREMEDSGTQLEQE